MLALWSRSLRHFKSDFGRPVAAVGLSLLGVVTPALGGEGRINILWNGQLVDSQPITDVDTYTADVSIGAPEVQRDNTLILQLEFLPRGGDCSLDGLPARLDINGERSSVEAIAGQTLNSFAMFPQPLPTVTPVAMGSGQDPTDSAVQAGHLIAALQRLTNTQLVLEVLAWEALLADSRPGIAVGVAPGEDTQLSTPLRYAPFRTIEVLDKRFTAEVKAPFAALQAYSRQSRELLVLDGYGQSQLAQANRLAALADLPPAGWFGLQGSIALAQPDVDVKFLTPDPIATQPQQTTTESLLSLQWLWWLSGVLLASLIIGFLLRRRSSRG